MILLDTVQLYNVMYFTQERKGRVFI